MSKKNIAKGNIPKMFELMVNIHENNPDAFRDVGYLRAVVSQTWKTLNDPEHCPNCAGSMMQYVHKLDFYNALLLKLMGDQVIEGMKRGLQFGDANQVHVVTQDIHDCVRHRTTQCRQLGLIAKVKHADGSHDRENGWLITKRGFAALRGEKVPAAVIVFNNEIKERDDELVTLDEVFTAYKGTKRPLIGQRDPMEWVNFGGLIKGQLL